MKARKVDVVDANLVFIDTEKLIRELGSRYNHFIMWGAKHVSGKGKTSKWNNHRVCQGDPTYCMGLTHRLMAFADYLAELQGDAPPLDDITANDRPDDDADGVPHEDR